MEDMKITGWTEWDDPNYQELWPIGDTSSTFAKEYAVRKLIAEELRRCGYKFTGGYHQNGEFGVPVIDDKWRYQCSQRVWGGIMAMAYPEEIDDTDGMGYVEWAWDSQHTTDNSVLPGVFEK